RQRGITQHGKTHHHKKQYDKSFVHCLSHIQSVLSYYKGRDSEFPSLTNFFICCVFFLDSSFCFAFLHFFLFCEKRRLAKSRYHSGLQTL
ncbi:MAG: hypothetical protein FWD31_15245, partial [Planctomycetaceae bacterium]|nr:hypothetical protein [Planctomycetaceae bacterium]